MAEIMGNYEIDALISYLTYRFRIQNSAVRVLDAYEVICIPAAYRVQQRET